MEIVNLKNMNSWYVSLSLTTIVFYLIYRYITRNFQYWEIRNVPYVKPFPFFGNLLSMMSLRQTMGEWFYEISKTINADYFGIFAFNEPILVIKSPKLLKSIFVKDFAYFEDRTPVLSSKDELASMALFLQKNPSWNRARTKLTPMFSSGKIKLMYPLMTEIADRMTHYMSEYANGTVEIKEVCAKYSTDVIARCAFAVDAKSFEHDDAVLRQIGRDFFSPKLDFIVRHIASRFLPTLMEMFNICLINPQITNTLRDIFFGVLKQREQLSTRKENDFVGLLLNLRTIYKDNPSFSYDGMLAQSVQMFMAGFETVASTITFLLYEIAIATNIQDKLREEIMNNTGPSESITYEAIQQLKYLDMVVHETLRKYPVLPFLDRRCNKDFPVPGTNLTIKKGTAVYIPLYALHFDTKYFPNPHKFDPERFRDKGKINTEGLSYIPFGEGPRMCIGNRFGLLNVKIGVVSILRRFKLSACPETPIPLTFDPKVPTLSSPVGISLKISPLTTNEGKE